MIYRKPSNSSLAARARPCAARTRLFGIINMPSGALRAPPPIAASLLLTPHFPSGPNSGRQGVRNAYIFPLG